MAQGQFTILNNIQQADGDFLQGTAVARFHVGAPLEVALSWHESSQGTQMLTLPSDPSTGTWTWRSISPFSQNEQLTAGDIGRGRRSGSADGNQMAEGRWFQLVPGHAERNLNGRRQKHACGYQPGRTTGRCCRFRDLRTSREACLVRTTCCTGRDLDMNTSSPLISSGP